MNHFQGTGGINPHLKNAQQKHTTVHTCTPETSQKLYSFVQF